jgi:hypothetical protein
MTPNRTFQDESAVDPRRAEDALRENKKRFRTLFGLAPAAVVASHRIMARELVWLEDNTFAAWGCGACNWVLANSGQLAKPSTQVKGAFDKHECAKFPRVQLTGRVRPPKNQSRIKQTSPEFESVSHRARFSDGGNLRAQGGSGD